MTNAPENHRDVAGHAHLRARDHRRADRHLRADAAPASLADSSPREQSGELLGKARAEEAYS